MQQKLVQNVYSSLVLENRQLQNEFMQFGVKNHPQHFIQFLHKLNGHEIHSNGMEREKKAETAFSKFKF